MPQRPDLTDDVRAAIALLETFATERERLLDVPEEDRNRLLRAAGEVSRPDAIRRRQMVKATKRNKKTQRREHILNAEAQLNSTGIRELRRRPSSPRPTTCSPAAMTRARWTTRISARRSSRSTVMCAR